MDFPSELLFTLRELRVVVVAGLLPDETRISSRAQALLLKQIDKAIGLCANNQSSPYDMSVFMAVFMAVGDAGFYWNHRESKAPTDDKIHEAVGKLTRSAKLFSNFLKERAKHFSVLRNAIVRAARLPTSWDDLIEMIWETNDQQEVAPTIYSIESCGVQGCPFPQL